MTWYLKDEEEYPNGAPLQLFTGPFKSAPKAAKYRAENFNADAKQRMVELPGRDGPDAPNPATVRTIEVVVGTFD